MKKLGLLLILSCVLLTGCRVYTREDTSLFLPKEKKPVAVEQVDTVETKAEDGHTDGHRSDTIARGNIRIGLKKELMAYDPVKSADIHDIVVYREVYARLYTSDEDMQPKMELAKTFEQVSENEYRITIHDATFSDGTSITAEDVAFSLNRARLSDNCKALVSDVEYFEATGDKEITIHTTRPVPTLELALGHTGMSIFPQWFLEEMDAGGEWELPITSGRYLFKEPTKDGELTIYRNPNYFDEESMPLNESITFVAVPDDSRRAQMIKNGDIDIYPNLLNTDYNIAFLDEHLELYSHSGVNMQYFAMDTTRPPFDNTKVRQAMAYGIDRDGMLIDVAEGLGEVSYNVLASSVLGFKTVNPANYEYDIDKAKELLTEAGYEDGFSMDIYVFSDTGIQQARYIAQNLKDLGIIAAVVVGEPSKRFDMIHEHECMTFCSGWGEMSDAGLVLPRLFGTGERYNWAFYSSETVDSLLEEARNISAVETRVNIYDKAVTKIMIDSPWVPLYVPNNYVLANKELEGIELDGETLINLHNIHFGE